jgi:hypothetical protein
MQRIKSIAFSLAVTIPPLVETSPPAAAADLTQEQLAGVVQSTANDTDMLLLSYLVTGPPTLSYRYNSAASDSTWANWSGSLNGRYSGQPLSLSYSNGVLSGFPPGAVSWTTLGALGGGAVAGGGLSSISYPTATTFDLAFNDSLSYGGNTASTEFSVVGTILPSGSYMFGTPSNGEAGGGTITLNGAVVADPSDWWSYILYPIYFYPPHQYYWRDDIFIPGWGVWWNTEGYGPYPPFPHSFYNGTVPELSTWAMMALGFGGLGYAGFRRAKARTGIA